MASNDPSPFYQKGRFYFHRLRRRAVKPSSFLPTRRRCRLPNRTHRSPSFCRRNLYFAATAKPPASMMKVQYRLLNMWAFLLIYFIDRHIKWSVLHLLCRSGPEQEVLQLIKLKLCLQKLGHLCRSPFSMATEITTPFRPPATLKFRVDRPRINSKCDFYMHTGSAFCPFSQH